MNTDDCLEDIPFSDIESVGIRYLSHTDLFLCTWQLGIFCNYSCSYCWPSAHSAQPDHKSLSVLTQTMDKVKTQARKQGLNSFRFSFVGGEPTLQKNFIDLIHHYSMDMENCNYQSLHITTNLSQKMKWFKSFIEAARPLDKSMVNASFHGEFARKEEFADKVQFLLENDIVCSISIVMIPEKFYSLLKDAEYFYNRLSIDVSLQSQIDFKGNPVSNYTKKMIEKLQTAFIHIKKDEKIIKKQNRAKAAKNIKKRFAIKDPHIMELRDSKNKIYQLDDANRLNALGFNRYKGWECSAGYRSLVIDSNGNIKRGHVCYDKSLGHIETGFQLHKSIKPCISPICTCTADNKVPKRIKGTKHFLFRNCKYTDPV